MMWFKIVVTVVLGGGAVCTILDIGKPRKPISSGIATCSERLCYYDTGEKRGRKNGY